MTPSQLRIASETFVAGTPYLGVRNQRTVKLLQRVDLFRLPTRRN